MRSIEWWIFNDLHGPLSWFSRSHSFMSNISPKKFDPRLTAGADLRQKASSATLPERPLPSPLPPSPPFSSLPSHPLPFPSPPLEVGPSNPARGLRECCKLYQWGLGLSPSRSNLVHFSLKICHLVATILMIFLRINWTNFMQFEH